MRIVFLGSGAFAVPSLEAIVRGGHEVLVVITQPDREKGRGRRPAWPPVKAAALAMGLPLRQPVRARDEATIAELRALAPDVQVVVAYGQILPRALFDVAPLGTVNLHASLLPRFRGAAPIQWAIARGAEQTGVTTMMIDEGLDTGPLLLSATTAITPDETAGHLEMRLAKMGAPLLIETLARLARHELTPQPQDEALASQAPLLRKQDGRIDWRLPAAEIACRVRAFNPWPCAHALLGSRLVRILRAGVSGERAASPGEIVRPDPGRLVVACGDGQALEILELQAEGRRPMSAAAFLAGARLTSAERFE